MSWLVYATWGLMALIGGSIGYVLAWVFSNPWNRALVMRSVLRKTYAVVLTRTRGGQIRFYTRELKGEKPMINIAGAAYTPQEAYAVYKGSVPTYGFNTWDTKPFHLGGVEGNEEIERWRNPHHINSILMLMKSLYETLADRKNELMFYAVIGALLFALLAMAFGYINYQEIQYLRADLTSQIATQGTHLANQIGG